MKNWGYKLENNTVYSVFDCESNKLDYNEKDMFEGAEVVLEMFVMEMFVGKSYVCL